MQVLSQAAFRSYQNKFHEKIMGTPHTVKVEIFSVVPKDDTSGEFDIETFVGDSKRTSKEYLFNALYEEDISTRTREKYGVTNLINGIVYLSPLQVLPVLGTYRIDKNKTIVHFNGAIQVIDKIDYMDELFGSCIAIQIFLKDATRGG